jgi:hypothetical protein
MAGNSQQFQASANINVSTFVALDGDNRIRQAVAADNDVIGIMHESAWDTPIPGANGTIAVPAEQSKRIYMDTESCEVIVGAVALTAGEKVRSDANGAAVVAGLGEQYFAVVTQGGGIGERAKVILQAGQN